MWRASRPASRARPRRVAHTAGRRTSRVSPRVPTSATTASSRFPRRSGTLATPRARSGLEAAVRDGLTSSTLGGSAETDPPNDALVEATQRCAAASSRSSLPATRGTISASARSARREAPEAITVGAVSSTYRLGPVVSVTDAARAGEPEAAPVPRVGLVPPSGTGRGPTRTADVGSITGSDGRPVDRQLCGVRSPEALHSTLPRNSLRNTIVLVFRGRCPLITKAYRACSSEALRDLMVDNRASEANRLPLDLSVPSGVVARPTAPPQPSRRARSVRCNPLEAKNAGDPAS